MYLLLQIVLPDSQVESSSSGVASSVRVVPEVDTEIEL